MSEKCCATAFPIGISRDVTPNAAIRSEAFECVLVVVPSPGIVIPIILFLSQPSLSKARTVTISANVLSSPPEMPITAVCEWI